MTGMGKLREIITRYSSFPGEATTTLPVIREGLVFLFLALLVFHVYANSKDGPFVFDDLPNIANNPHIRISRLDWQSLRQAAFESPIPTRPLANVSFALNYYVNHLDPKSFRLVNVLIHLGNGLLLLFFLKATLRTPALGGLKQLNRFMPYAAATIWIVNPVHTQSVSYIVQRMNSMAVLFSLLAFLLYIHARLSRNRTRRRLLLGGGLLAFLMALGSKENTITLPFFVFLYEWYFFRDLNFQWLKKNSWRLLVIALFLAGVAWVYVELTPLVKTLYEYQATSLTLPQRFMTQFRIVIFYLFLFLFPHPARLNLDHHFPVSLSLLDPPTTLLSILAVLAILLSAVITVRRYRLLSFAILWFMGNLVIEASVPGLDMVFEHRTYLPSILISMIMVMFLYQFVAHVWARRIVLLIFVAVGAIWTHDRNLVWADKAALWEDAANKSPEKARPNINAGIAYSEVGRFEKGIRYLEQAVKLQPDYVHPRINLASSLLIKGDYRRAEHHARAVLPMKPVDRESLNLLVMARNIVGKSLALQGKGEEALDHFYQARELNPDNASTSFNLSLTLTNLGRLMEAEEHCAEALRIQPDYRAARLHLQEIRQHMELRKPSIYSPFSQAVQAAD
jgi:tetratricopeptide (TPR) repeat protein